MFQLEAEGEASGGDDCGKHEVPWYEVCYHRTNTSIFISDGNLVFNPVSNLFHKKTAILLFHLSTTLYDVMCVKWVTMSDRRKGTTCNVFILRTTQPMAKQHGWNSNTTEPN
jgi:hypothetical protein